MQIDWWTLGLQTINFLVVIWLLSRFLYRPIRKIIEEREAADQAASQAAQDMKDAAEKTRRTYEEERERLTREQTEREAAFQHGLEAERARYLEAARKEADALLSEARDRIERDQHQALENLKGRVLELASDLARAALAAPVSIDEAIGAVSAHLGHLSQADFDDLKDDLDTKGAKLEIVSPEALSDAEQDAWRGAISKKFGPDVAFVFKTDANILGGVELHFPHAVLRFSVADRLDQAAKSLEA